MNVRLHIDRLVLDGIPLSPDQRPHLQWAIEAELTRLLSTGGINGGMQGGTSLHSLRAEQIQLAPDSGPAEMGRQIAGVVYEGIAR